jgi:hypothetical protein
MLRQDEERPASLLPPGITVSWRRHGAPSISGRRAINPISRFSAPWGAFGIGISSNQSRVVRSENQRWTGGVANPLRVDGNVK